jgi:hypothetical protein
MERDRSTRRRDSSDAVYGNADWRRFRERFFALLVEANVVPCCGAQLPDGPATNPSLCRGAALSFANLHLHHEPELSQAERQAAVLGDRRAVDDPQRIVALCKSCHSSTTMSGRRR